MLTILRVFGFAMLALAATFSFAAGRTLPAVMFVVAFVGLAIATATHRARRP